MNIESQRLRFCKYTDNEFEYLADLLNNPEMVKYIGEGKTKDREGAKNFLEWIYHTYNLGSGLGLMVLEDKERNNQVGHAGLVPQVIEGEEEIEIGYWVSKEHWGRGYATEAARALLHYGHHQLRLTRFISLIQPGNTASQRVAEKIGMTLEKMIIQGNQDVYVYSTTKYSKFKSTSLNGN
ncbi:GNAT family N-acetyltransferase [Halobacillus andaensis]|uniref:GNAT family N-acetyltransferase n=1 Tax=Halobacillus andaensis TaxID=1176239 RepID=UPI003D730102